MSANRFIRVFEVLLRHEVEFIVVGGVAAVLQRVPINTLDLDIVHRRTPDNVRRLLEALRELAAVYRNDPRNLSPNESHLMGDGAQLLRTNNLDFDVLGAIHGGLTYEELLAHSDKLEVAGKLVLVLSLEKLTEVKRALTRPKDKLMLMHLEAALEERGRTR
jgi:hypothetical protein